MAKCPFAEVQLIPKWNKVAITRYRRMNLHVAVSGQDNIRDMFARSSSACSHFYVNRKGEIFQYIDTKYRSAADRDGNDSTISVETEGGLGNSKAVNSETWSAAQVTALAKLWAWARDTHNIKDQVAKNTCSNDNSAGLSWHRLGIKGNFGGRGGILEVGYCGILYSGAFGKECPGDAKILQIPGIHEMAKGKTYKQIDGKVNKPKPESPKPTGNTPKPKRTNVQSPSNLPDGSANFPDNYVDLPINGKFSTWEVGAFQILCQNIFELTYNQRWDGDFGPMTIKDFQSLLRRNGYYIRTPFAARGLRKGVKLVVDGDAGYWFWTEVQRMMGNAEKNRANGKVYYDLKKYRLDGDPGKFTYDALSRWMNDNN